ncbi:GNAT family N-acetyltransferase [Pseudoxanthomonas putridarboris]|uniref:GNAT family N-acetyltransferase n=1 Tax=Pseudoxanthomonas putridarboris TaxID=752605 RepID=A0ABU9J2H8_9GAMM
MSIALAPGQTVVETGRLRLLAMSDASDQDAAMMLRLLNDPGFIRHIADRGVRTLEEARGYLRNGALRGYAEQGYAMYAVQVKATGALAGNCGLVRREGLEGPDLGYALLPEFCGQGYALEAARGVLKDARDRLGLDQVFAIVNPDNAASISLLQKLRFAFERMTQLPGVEREVKLFRYPIRSVEAQS